MAIAEATAQGVLLVTSRDKALAKDEHSLALSCAEGVVLETVALKDFLVRPEANIPDFLILPPGAGLLARVRSHPRLSLLPCYRLGKDPAPEQEPWDGNLFEVGGAVLRRCSMLTQRLESLTPIMSRESKSVCEERLLRFVATRGAWCREWAPFFGLPGLRSLENRWIEEGWLELAEGESFSPTAALSMAVSVSSPEAITPEPLAINPVVDVHVATKLSEEKENKETVAVAESDSTRVDSAPASKSNKANRTLVLPTEPLWPRAVVVMGFLLLLPWMWKFGALS